MKPQTFTIYCGPGTLWKCRVFIHPNLKSMLRNRNRNKPQGKCSAFCRQFGVDDAWGKGDERGFAAEMHFNRKSLKIDHIVHEAVHASIAWLKLVKLDVNTHTGDESFAESVEHLVCGTLWQLKQMKIKAL